MRVTAAVNGVLGSMLFLMAAQPRGASAQSETLELRNGERAAGGVEVVVSTPESRESVGVTNVMGKLDFPAALLTGKVRAEVYAVECDERTTVLVVPDGADLNAEDASCKDEDDPEDSCRCRRLGLFYWPFDTIELGARGGFPARTVAIGSGVGASLLVGIAALGGDEGSSNGPPASNGSVPSATIPTPTATTPPPDPTTPAATPSASGTYPTSFTIRRDRANHRCCIPMPPNMNLLIEVEGASISVTGNSPFVPVMGPYQAPGLRLRGVFDVRAGTFNATGSGTVAGFSGVRVELQGQISDVGELTGTYSMGTAGRLPQGEPILYELRGRKQ